MGFHLHVCMGERSEFPFVHRHSSRTGPVALASLRQNTRAPPNLFQPQRFAPTSITTYSHGRAMWPFPFCLKRELESTDHLITIHSTRLVHLTTCIPRTIVTWNNLPMNTSVNSLDKFEGVALPVIKSLLKLIGTNLCTSIFLFHISIILFIYTSYI